MKNVLLITDKFIFTGFFYTSKNRLIGNLESFTSEVDFYFNFPTNYSCIGIFLSNTSIFNFISAKRKLFERFSCPIVDLNNLLKNIKFFSFKKFISYKTHKIKTSHKIVPKEHIARNFFENQIKNSMLNVPPWNSFLIDINFEQREFLFKVKRACDTDGIILLLGTSGSGKNYTANLIHNNSKRRSSSFINQNLAELNPMLIESKLFGTTKSAYTDAIEGKGLFEEIGEGSLCLDEVHETSLNVQSKIYDILDTAKYSRMGNNIKRKFGGRLIFTTNADLKFLVQDGKFKEPLYYRIKVFVIKVPSLHEHIQDLNPLALKFANDKNKTLTCGALNLLHNHGWPGNIRELKNVIYSACDLCNTFDVDERFIKFDT